MDQLGATLGHISSKDSRVTGTNPLPVYKGKLAVTRKEDKPKGEKTEKQKQMEAYLKKYGGGDDASGGGGEKKLRRKKKKPKTEKGNLRIIDEEEGCEGLALAKAKGAFRISDEEMSDEEAVVISEEEIKKREEAEKRSMVQVGDGGDGGSKWVTVDEDGNIINDPAEKKEQTGGGDLSPPRRGKDLSPPRRRPTAGGGGEDLSPPRGGKRRHDSDSDQSPPRRRGGGSGGGGDLSPPRRRGGGDLSPPRRRGGGDLSPPRRRGGDSDSSPPRRGGGEDSSPPRRRRHDSDSDSSPPRRRAGGAASAGDSSPRRRTRHDSSDSEDEGKGGGGQKPAIKTVNGLRAGFVSGRELNDTMDQKKAKEDEKFKKLKDEETGRVAATVYRDKSGKRVAGEDANKELSREEREEQEMKNMVWGKGLVQMEKQADLKAQIEKEKSMPFARRVDDQEMNDHLKEQSRWGDPMAGKVKTKSNKPKYQGPFPPNRYGIAPGYRWDGVNRSNGFESKWFASRNDRAVLEAEAHAWSTEAM